MPIINLETIEKKELLPGYKVRFVHSDNLTFTFWDVKAGSILPKHSHVHEQISQITEGVSERTDITCFLHFGSHKSSFKQM
jgi:hypothetical protein